MPRIARSKRDLVAPARASPHREHLGAPELRALAARAGFPKRARRALVPLWNGRDERAALSLHLQPPTNCGTSVVRSASARKLFTTFPFSGCAVVVSNAM